MALRTPGKVSDILISSFSRLSINARLREYRVLRLWPAVVGGDIVKKTKPVRFISGKLYVTVSSSPWMSELMHLKMNIKDKLNRELSEDAVDDIVFRLGKVSEGDKKHITPDTDHPLSQDDVAFVKETVSGIKDDELRSMLARVMEKYKVCDIE
jgi:predicted nucleic acid-binding Zn ribbon protein